MVSMIRQKLGQKTFTSYIPAKGEDALDIAKTILPGIVSVFEKKSETGSDNVSDGYKKFTIMIKNDAGAKTYFSIVTKLGKSSKDVINALKGKTFNTVKADVVYVLNEREYKFAKKDNSNSGNNSNS